MFEAFDHPWVLFAAAITSLPVLFPIVRFFFDDFETFKSDAGLQYEHDRALWLFGLPGTDPYFVLKLVGIVGSYGLLVVAVYQLLCRLFY